MKKCFIFIVWSCLLTSHGYFQKSNWILYYFKSHVYIKYLPLKPHRGGNGATLSTDTNTDCRPAIGRFRANAKQQIYTFVFTSGSCNGESSGYFNTHCYTLYFLGHYSSIYSVYLKFSYSKQFETFFPNLSWLQIVLYASRCETNETDNIFKKAIWMFLFNKLFKDYWLEMGMYVFLRLAIKFIKISF